MSRHRLDEFDNEPEAAYEARHPRTMTLPRAANDGWPAYDRDHDRRDPEADAPLEDPEEDWDEDDPELDDEDWDSEDDSEEED
jgi:hypothetical protein